MLRLRRLETGAGDAIEVLRATYRDFAFAPHAHAEYAIGVAVAGRHVLVCRGVDHVVEPGNMIVIPPETVHEVYSCGRVPWTYVMMFIPPAVLPAPPGSHWRGVADHVVVRRNPAAAAVENLADDLLGLDGLRISETTIAAVRRVVLEGLELCHSAASPFDPAVASLLRLAAIPSRKNPSLRRVCAAHHLSAFQVIRRFRKAFEISPIAYHVQRRVRLARELLCQSRSIGEAAYRAGYSDQPHLTRHFKRVFGVTPGQYLRALQAYP